MITSNIDLIPGKKIIEHYGLVSGSTVRAKHVGSDILAGFKNLVGGELKAYTELLEEAREQALDRMIQQAQGLGANAVINVRFSTSSVVEGAAEIYVYGTAVKVD
ncbi:MAG: YbjQ family protein [Candidatus Caenarcaniphilales bacterium]|nr:YbjQ family protein [Candidatus Caenarcaniphilales bacterium]